jgi:hypothetical protein
MMKCEKKIKCKLKCKLKVDASKIILWLHPDDVIFVKIC